MMLATVAMTNMPHRLVAKSARPCQPMNWAIITMPGSAVQGAST